MKKLTLTLSAILILTLAACGGTPATQRSNNSGQPNGSSTELPMASKLIVGSFKLEDTDLAVTSKQAADLLPLWQVFHDLSTSDTAAPQEINALTEQIQETMTPAQMKAINELNLTQRDVFTFMREQGIQFGNGTGQSTQGTGRQSSGGASQPGGGPLIFQANPGGGRGGPGGGFGGGQGQGFSPQQIATAQALRAANGGSFRSNRTPAPLVEALIKMLQQKAGS